MPHISEKNKGILAILGASLMWAIEPILVKLAYKSSDFLQISTTRTTVACMVGFAYLLTTNKLNVRITKSHFIALVYIAVAGTVVADLLYLLALSRIPVINAVLIGHMQPIAIILLGYFALKEDKLTKHDYTGIFIMIAAGLLVTTKNVENLYGLRLGTSGDLLVLLAMVVWATTAIVTRKYLRQLNAGVIILYRFVIAAVIFAGYLALTKTAARPNLYQTMVGLVVGIGFVLYYEGLRRIKAAQVSAMELSTPFFASILSFVIIDEVITTMQMLGIALLFSGVYFLSKKEEVYF